MYTNGGLSQYTCATLSPDCRRLAAGCEASAVKSWQLYPGEGEEGEGEHGSASRDLEDGPDRILLGCDWISPSGSSPPGGRLASPGGCRTLVGHGGPVYGCSFVGGPASSSSSSSSSRMHHLLSAGEDCSMRIWEVGERGGGRCRAVYRGHAYPIWCLDVDRLGINIVTGESALSIHGLRCCGSFKRDN